MALTVGELAATIKVDDTEGEQGLRGFQDRLRSALSRITRAARTGGEDAGGELGDGLAEAAGDGADAAGESITGKLQGLALGVIGGTLGAALMGGIAEAMDQEKIASKLGAQLGATGPEAKRYGQIAGRLYASAITEDFQGAADAISATIGSGLINPDATNAQIESISTKVADLAATFDQDLGGVTNAVSQLMRTGLAKNATEALDLIAKGFGTSANKGDDFLDTLNEYSTQFRRIGLDGQTAVGLIDQAVKAGARDSDQVADAIGQFGELALGQSQGVKDAFKSIGLDSDTVAAKLKKGGKSGKDALQMTTDALRNTKDETKRLNAATALFGDPGTVMGDALFALDPATAAASSGMDGATGSAGKLGDTLRDNASTQVEQFKRKVQQSLVDFLGRTVIPRLSEFFSFVQEHSGAFKAAAIGVAALGTAFSLAAIGVWAMNSAMLANPMFWIIGGIAIALAGLVILIVTYWDQIKGATSAAWGWVVDQVSGAKDGILAAVGWLAAVPGRVGGWFGDMKDSAVRKSLELVTWLTGLPGRVGSSIGGMGSTLRHAASRSFQSFRDASVQKVSSFISWVRGIPGQISRGIGSLSGLLTSKGQDVVRGLWNGIKSMGAWLRDTLIGWAKSIIPGPIAKALGIASPSRVMRDQIGKWIPAGIVEGIESGSGAVDTTMRNLVSVPTAGQATAAHVAAQTGGAVSGGAASGAVVRIGSDGSAFGDFIISTLRQAVGTRGGNVQFAITGRS